MACWPFAAAGLPLKTASVILVRRNQSGGGNGLPFVSGLPFVRRPAVEDGERPAAAPPPMLD